MKFHYLKKLIYITEIVNAHYFGVHIHYFGSDLLITTTVVKFHDFTFRKYTIRNAVYRDRLQSKFSVEHRDGATGLLVQ